MKKNKVLLVDDDPDIREIISLYLFKEGFEVHEAESGTKALEIVQEVIPDLFILDIMMPEMDGITLAKKIRKDSSFDKSIIVFLTAKAQEETHIEALELGGDDFITKPLKPKILMSRVKAALRRKEDPADRSDIIEVGDLVIDKVNFQVTKNEKEIELAKKEFELLVLLASKPNKLFTREVIYNKIWGPDIIVGSRTIDVHIRKLRGKLGPDYIKTQKGFGYKFVF